MLELELEEQVRVLQKETKALSWRKWQGTQPREGSCRGDSVLEDRSPSEAAAFPSWSLVFGHCHLCRMWGLSWQLLGALV